MTLVATIAKRQACSGALTRRFSVMVRDIRYKPLNTAMINPMYRNAGKALNSGNKFGNPPSNKPNTKVPNIAPQFGSLTLTTFLAQALIALCLRILTATAPKRASANTITALVSLSSAPSARPSRGVKKDAKVAKRFISICSGSIVVYMYIDCLFQSN